MDCLIDHSRRKFYLYIALLALAIASLACQIEVGGPEAPGDPISTLEGSPIQLSTMWEQALEAAITTGQVFVIFDEAQLTTFLAHEMAESDDPAILAPQVYLQEDTLQIYGIVDQGPFLAKALLIIKPLIDADGQISFEVTQADIGPLPVPGALKDTISAILTEAFTGTIGSLATGIRISSIAITDGEMAIVGELR